MKKITCFIIVFCSFKWANAQVTITSNTHLRTSGNVQVVLSNMNLFNDGTLSNPTEGRFVFNGNTNNAISGSNYPIFYELEIAKTGSNQLLLQRAIDVLGKIIFTSGLIELNNYNIDLGSVGVLENESETSRITGITGGKVTATRTLNAPASVNAANLGAIISSSQNLGLTSIQRGHKSQVNSFGNGTTLHRFFDIIPANNTALNVTLRFQYFDAELNSLPEAGLKLWKSTDNVHWSYQGSTAANTTANYVEKTGIADFSRWTLTTANNPLPVQLVLFNGKCDNGKLHLNWRTATEINSSHFVIERSTDARSWSSLATVTAAGNSTTEINYSYTDNTPLQNGFYRLAQYDINGVVHYSGVLRVSCGAKDLFNAWPNPVLQNVFVSLNVATPSIASLQLFDSKGRKVKEQRANLLQGNNLVTMNMNGLASGSYQLVIWWNEGIEKATQMLMKQ